MIKKVIAASIALSVVVSGTALAMTQATEAMMKNDDSATMMMMKKEEQMKASDSMMKKEVKSMVKSPATVSEIAELQNILIEKGFLVIQREAPKGNFGPLTKAALIKYQKSVGLPATGYFGTLTKAKLSDSKAMMMKKEGQMKASDSMMKKETTN